MWHAKTITFSKFLESRVKRVFNTDYEIELQVDLNKQMKINEDFLNFFFLKSLESKCS